MHRQHRRRRGRTWTRWKASPKNEVKHATTKFSLNADARMIEVHMVALPLQVRPESFWDRRATENHLACNRQFNEQPSRVQMRREHSKGCKRRRP
mmetsp:Transcript_4063/g.7817  ORF Transcript_4063/g.7817 Transcript_4063/m.7817 type:complete len:95 (+) Transcript_4063:39-323(+)